MCVPVLSFPSSSFLSLSCRSLPCGTRLWKRLQDAPVDAPARRACNVRSCPFLSFLFLCLPLPVLSFPSLRDAPVDAPAGRAWGRAFRTRLQKLLRMPERAILRVGKGHCLDSG